MGDVGELLAAGDSFAAGNVGGLRPASVVGLLRFGFASTVRPSSGAGRPFGTGTGTGTGGGAAAALQASLATLPASALGAVRAPVSQLTPVPELRRSLQLPLELPRAFAAAFSFASTSFSRTVFTPRDLARSKAGLSLPGSAVCQGLGLGVG